MEGVEDTVACGAARPGCCRNAATECDRGSGGGGRRLCAQGACVCACARVCARSDAHTNTHTYTHTHRPLCTPCTLLQVAAHMAPTIQAPDSGTWSTFRVCGEWYAGGGVCIVCVYARISCAVYASMCVSCVSGAHIALTIEETLSHPPPFHLLSPLHAPTSTLRCTNHRRGLEGALPHYSYT